MDLVDLAHAAAERDAGMKAALDHADRVEPKWSSEAYSFLLSYARANEAFISEDVTEAAKDKIATPVTLKAWGGIFQKAARAGVIRRIGYGVAKRRHLSPTPLWASRVYKS